MPKLQQGTQVSKELHDCTGLAQGNVKFSSMSAKCRAIVSVYSKAAGPVHGGCLVDSDIPGHWGARLWAARQAAHQHNALFRAVHYVSPEDPPLVAGFRHVHDKRSRHRLVLCIWYSGSLVMIATCQL